MAFIDCHFFSDSLGLSTSMYVVLPQTAKKQIGMEANVRNDKHPVLYLLHGLSDDHTIWMRRTSIERYASAMGLAVVMPAVNRSFYADMPNGQRYWEFVSEELPELARSFFPLSDRREDNFVAGLSMGGYGAMKLGLSLPDRYAAAASLSGVMDIRWAIEDLPPHEFNWLAGDAPSVLGTDKDLFYLAERLADSGSGAGQPKLYQCCGTEDFLYGDNIRFRDHCRKLGLELTYEEEPGEHEWGYWDVKIKHVLEWLPLKGGLGLLKWDGHTHTRFCKHGSPAELELYIDRAIELGFRRYSITEHPPLPERWVKDEQLMAELAMSMEELPQYLDYVQIMKDKYVGAIEITAGLEMDYLAAAESFSDVMLKPCLDVLEDVVVSVHYLPGVGGMRCIDFTPGDFSEGLLAYYGSIDAVVETYYDQVEKALEWASSLPMRKRLGHINLIEKFRTALPEMDSSLIERRLRGILPKLESAGIGIDVNTACLRVATCGKPYVPEWFIRECRARGIDCVYGSDSHKPEQVGLGWDWFETVLQGS